MAVYAMSVGVRFDNSSVPRCVQHEASRLQGLPTDMASLAIREVLPTHCSLYSIRVQNCIAVDVSYSPSLLCAFIIQRTSRLD